MLVQLDETNYDDLASSNNISMVYFGPDNEEFQQFKSISSEFYAFEFYYSHDEEFKIKTNNSKLEFFRPHRGGKIDWPYDIRNNTFREWIHHHYDNVVHEMSHTDAKIGYLMNLSVTFVFLDEKIDYEGQYFQAFEKVAEHYHKAYHFIYGDAENEDMDYFRKLFKHDTIEFPSILIIHYLDYAPETIYIKGYFDVKGLVGLIKKYENNELEHSIESEPIPENEVDEHGIIKIVGKTWHKFRNHVDKHLFVLVYASSKSNNEKAKQVMRDAIDEYKDHSDEFLIGMIDYEKNGIDFNARKYKAIFPFIIHYLPGHQTIPTLTTLYPTLGLMEDMLNHAIDQDKKRKKKMEMANNLSLGVEGDL